MYATQHCGDYTAKRAHTRDSMNSRGDVKSRRPTRWEKKILVCENTCVVVTLCFFNSSILAASLSLSWGGAPPNASLSLSHLVRRGYSSWKLQRLCTHARSLSLSLSLAHSLHLEVAASMYTRTHTHANTHTHIHTHTHTHTHTNT
jgi:hypothetical protein